MPQYYPRDLPYPEAVSYAQQGKPKFVRTEMESGRVKQRRLYAKAGTTQTFEWTLTGEQKRQFRAWYEHALKGGADSFWINVWKDKESKFVEAQFTQPPEEQVVVTNQAWWTVRAEVYILSQFTDDEERKDDVVYAMSAKITYLHDTPSAEYIILGQPPLLHTVVGCSVVTLEPIDCSGAASIDVGAPNDNAITDIVSGLDLKSGTPATKYNEENVITGHGDDGAEMDVAQTVARMYQVRMNQATFDSTKGEYVVILRYTVQE